jgi:DNA recombination protein RmuC
MRLDFIILAISIIAIFIIQRYYLAVKTLKDQLKKTELELMELNSSYLSLNESKSLLEKELIITKCQLDESSRKIEQWHQTKDEAMQYAKAAVFEVGNQLSAKLLEEHKRETQDAQKNSKEKIDETTTKIDQQFQSLVNIVSALNGQVKDSKDTVDLVKRALLSPTGAGALAEITLENILKSSGLISGVDFIMQYSINDNLENHRLRPDAIILLPAGNIMIIDSKASKFFTELASDADNKEIIAKLKSSMRNHLKELSAKDYKEAVKTSLNKAKFTKDIKHISNIMFLPTESALEKLQTYDPEFMQKAWELGIFPAGPVSIINILSHAKFMISEEKQQHNHEVIIEEVRKLLASISVVFDHIKRVGQNIQSAASNYDKLAGSFNSNILPKTRNIQKLGVTTPHNKTINTYLERYQIVSTSDVLIEVPSAEAESDKLLEEI